MLTTVGQLLINEALPEDLRDYTRHITKKSAGDLLLDVAQSYPEKYKKVAHDLMQIGQSVATTSGVSFSLADFTPGKAKQKAKKELAAQIHKIANDPRLDAKARGKAIIDTLSARTATMATDLLEHDAGKGNRLADVVRTGSKGSPAQYNLTVGIPLLFSDHKKNPIPVPILNSAAEGLDPAEFYASSFGTRQGLLATKLATAEAGDFGKQLAKASHRLIVSERDCGVDTGLPAEGDDRQNIGAVLAKDAGGLKAGTIIQPEHLRQLRDKSIVVRSPITCQAEGVCAKCAGVRERGSLPDIGDNVGIPAAQALSERMSQGSLNVKHTAGVASGARSYGFADVERLFQMPKHYPGAAKLSDVGGRVTDIKPAAAGGVDLTIGDTQHWVEDASQLKVKKGDVVEAGDALSEGIMNPREVASHRGVGEARRQFVQDVMTVSNGNVNRRNAELIARAAVSHLEITRPDDDEQGNMVGDIVNSDTFAKYYKPRKGSVAMTPTTSHGMYLERPVLHYSIGTKVDKRVANTLKSAGANNILVHKDEPTFAPKTERMMTHMSKDPDWMVRMHGYYLKDSLLDAVHKGLTSDERSTSFVPSLAKGVDFGKPLEGGSY